MELRTVLSPNYLREFSCIGSECEDTCCSGWQITIDEKSYNKYQSDQEHELSLKSYLKKLEGKSNKEYFAEVILEANSSCPMLNQDRLCSLHKEKGEEYLSNLCVTYPRVSNIINGIYERSTTLSCPEAARVVLLKQEGIKFEKIDEALEERHLISRKINTNKKVEEKREKFYLIELREFTIKLLQNRNYSLSERLNILGFFLEEVNNSLSLDEKGRVQLIIEDFKEKILYGEIKEYISIMPKSVTKHLEIVRKLIDNSIFSGIKDKRYLNSLMEALEGLRYTGSLLCEESVNLYIDANKTYYEPFIENNEYIMENYLVNTVFKNLFPIKRGILEDYMMLVVHYALIKFQLIGMMSYHKENFEIEHVIKLIQSYSRNVEHVNKQPEQFIKVLKENQYTSFKDMAIFVSF